MEVVLLLIVRTDALTVSLRLLEGLLGTCWEAVVGLFAVPGADCRPVQFSGCEPT